MVSASPFSSLEQAAGSIRLSKEEQSTALATVTGSRLQAFKPFYKSKDKKMQAVRDKLHDITAMRKAKSEAKAEEKAEKELAKARVEVAHEVRLAREAEAAMSLHVAKAGKRAEKEMAKHANTHTNIFVAPGDGTTTKVATAPGVTMVGAPGTVDMVGPHTVHKKTL